MAFRYYLARYVFDAGITRTTRRSSLPSCLMRYWQGRAPPRPQKGKNDQCQKAPCRSDTLGLCLCQAYTPLAASDE